MNNMYKALLPLALLLAMQSQAQNLAAWSDFQNYFFVFEDGTKRQVEYQKIRTHKVGGTAVAYENNQGNFKVYHDGKATKLADFVDQYFATDYLIGYTQNGQLKIFEDGVKKTLSAGAPHFAVSDSIAAYYDNFVSKFRVYYDGKSTDLEDGLIGPISNFKVRENILAYVNRTNYFKIFYQGELIEIMQLTGDITYAVGRNTVAYVDPLYNNFIAFYKGEDIEIEEQTPQSFKVGDDLVAYVDQLGIFKCFDGNETKEISSFEPDFYVVKDEIIAYREQGIFKVFYNGTVYPLENYTPDNYNIDNDMLVYIDQLGKLQAFMAGTKKEVTTERVVDFQLALNTIRYDVGNKKNKVYFKGKVYQ
jgi:hypothetical protein